MRSEWGVVLLLFLVVDIDAECELRVNTTFGVLRGTVAESELKRCVSSFLGIPYARAPIGDLRFKSPQPWNESWEGERFAGTDGPPCVQLGSDDVPFGSEDCLYLNVFVPSVNNPNETKFPILVFVHGGGFDKGSSNSSIYGPDYIADQNVILVTLNYRLGPLGFFSTGDEASPGNYGLKDIVEALNWLQRNAESFGGDRHSVTLWGYEAGAAAVHTLTLSDRSKDLFHRYITQSGTSLAPWAFHTKENARIASLDLAYWLDCTDGEINATETVECLRLVEAQRIATASTFHRTWWTYPKSIFGPTVEPQSEEAIITRHPLLLIKENQIRDIPWITGIMTGEALRETVDLQLNETKRRDLYNLTSALLDYLEYEQVLTHDTSFIDELQDFYFGANVTEEESYEGPITELIDDAMTTWPVHRTLQYQANVTSSDVYFYVLSYSDTCSDENENASPEFLNYFFCYPSDEVRRTSNPTTVHILTEMWANFAKYGTPKASLTTDWKPYQIDAGFLRFPSDASLDIGMENEFKPETMAFWEQLANNVSLSLTENLEDRVYRPKNSDYRMHQSENRTEPERDNVIDDNPTTTVLLSLIGVVIVIAMISLYCLTAKRGKLNVRQSKERNATRES